MALENPTWGAPRVFYELRKLKIKLARSTVSKYLPESNNRPDPQTWKTFMRNHAKEIASCDFFTVPAWNFAALYCIVVMTHDRRKILHLNVTRNPTDKWTAKQLNLALKDEPQIKYLIHDNGGNFAQQVKEQLTTINIKQISTGLQAPWQNGHCERLIGIIKHECANHIIPLGVPHLRNILREYLIYYNDIRCHGSLDGDAPNIRAPDPPENGPNIIAVPVLGGLHHYYKRVA